MTTQTKSTPVTDVTTDTALVVLVVDRSGSMNDICSDMEGGIASLLASQEEFGDRCLVTIAQFDDEYEIVAERTPLTELAPYQLKPRGMTALLDAIGRTITTTKTWLDDLTETERPRRILCVVVTDGMENSSREWSRLQVMDSVKARIAEGWDFTFLGANQDAIEEGSAMGFAAEQSLTYDASSEGTRSAFKTVSRKISHQMMQAPGAAYAFSEAERIEALGDKPKRRSRRS